MSIILIGCMPKVQNPIAKLEQEVVSVNFLKVNDTEELLLELEKEKIPDFLDQLKEIPCYMIMNDPPESTEGETVKLSFADGSYMLINYMNIAIHKDGEVDHDAYYFKKEHFFDLWDKYVEVSDEK